MKKMNDCASRLRLLFDPNAALINSHIPSRHHPPTQWIEHQVSFDINLLHPRAVALAAAAAAAAASAVVVAAAAVAAA